MQTISLKDLMSETISDKSSSNFSKRSSCDSTDVSTSSCSSADTTSTASSLTLLPKINEYVAPNSSHDTSTTQTTNSKKRWRRAVNVLNITKQIQKVRFIVDPKLHEDINEYPVELQECTVDESSIHYTNKTTADMVTSYIKERSFWNFINSDAWTNAVHVTYGKLQNSLMEYINRLVAEEKVIIFKSVIYTSANTEMRGFVQRGREIFRKGRNSKSTDSQINCYRITKEYFCCAKTKRVESFAENSQVIDGNKLWREKSSRLSCMQNREEIDDSSVHSSKASIKNTEEKYITNSDEDTSLESNSKPVCLTGSDLVLSKEAHVESTSSITDKNLIDENDIENMTSVSKEVDTQQYFLPRISSNFSSECYEGLRRYQVSRESITNNLSWKTLHEIIITKV